MGTAGTVASFAIGSRVEPITFVGQCLGIKILTLLTDVTPKAVLIPDLDRLYAETSEKGLRFNNPPSSQLNDQGKVLMKACYAQDPDGNWLEFVEVF